MDNTALADNLEGNGELAMLLAQPPIAFHRVFVDLTNSATAALLLSSLIEHQEQVGVGTDEWFETTAEQISARTGLSRKEQATARRTLRDLKLLDERREGFPARFELRINFSQVSTLLIGQARKRLSQSRSIGVTEH